MLVNKDFQTWHLMGWQHSCQPIRSHVRKSLLTNLELTWILLSNPQPWSYVFLALTHRNGSNSDQFSITITIISLFKPLLITIHCRDSKQVPDELYKNWKLHKCNSYICSKTDWCLTNTCCTHPGAAKLPVYVQEKMTVHKLDMVYAKHVNTQLMVVSSEAKQLL